MNAWSNPPSRKPSRINPTGDRERTIVATDATRASLQMFERPSERKRAGGTREKLTEKNDDRRNSLSKRVGLWTLSTEDWGNCQGRAGTGATAGGLESPRARFGVGNESARPRRGESSISIRWVLQQRCEFRVGPP